MSADFIPLPDPHVTAAEIEAVTAVLRSHRHARTARWLIRNLGDYLQCQF